MTTVADAPPQKALDAYSQVVTTVARALKPTHGRVRRAYLDVAVPVVVVRNGRELMVDVRLTELSD